MAATGVTDPDDPRLVHFARLTDMQLRKLSEPAAGIFVAEGEKVIRRALAAGLNITAALMAPKWWPALEPVIPASAPVYLAPPELLQQITGFRVHRGALATFARPVPPDPRELLARAGTALLLEDLVDHANVGAVFRSAAGMGVEAVLVTERCADPWYRRSVKTSMGAVFEVPWTTVPDTASGLALARQAGMNTVALDPGASASLRQWRGSGPTMMLLGSEGPGLSDLAIREADLRLAIPMANGVDSLNVAMAGAIACYALTS